MTREGPVPALLRAGHRPLHAVAPASAVPRSERRRDPATGQGDLVSRRVGLLGLLPERQAGARPGRLPSPPLARLHRHITLSAAAHACLTVLRARALDKCTLPRGCVAHRLQARHRSLPSTSALALADLDAGRRRPNHAGVVGRPVREGDVQPVGQPTSDTRTDADGAADAGHQIDTTAANCVARR